MRATGLSVRLCTGVEAGIRRPAVLTRRVAFAVHFGTAQFGAGAYSGDMQHLSIRMILAVLYVSAVGIAGDLNSPFGWTILASVAIVPPLALLRRWHEPRQSMSQNIQEALR